MAKQPMHRNAACDDNRDPVFVQLSTLCRIARRVFRKADGQRSKRDQAVAIFDLVNNNTFAPVGHGGGPYWLCLALADRRLVISVTTDKGAPILCHHLSLTSFRRLFKDYSLCVGQLLGCKGWLGASKARSHRHGTPAIHNEASELLIERLRSIDLETARRLFTLIHILMEQDTPYRPH
ncbi:UPF0262 family protein [Mesorhizobium sp. M0924]|uniref:UPF0262 family protein n=1 Tax=unclassified Mesorhizobium TaxID=325217 RepID=UPI00333DABD6